MNRSLEQELAYWDTVIQLRPSDPNAYVRRGMTQFKLGQVAASIADFDRAEALEPAITPYLWQRGLSYYYADRFAEGARQFEIDLQVNRHDVEETVWRYLCIAQDRGVEEAKQSLFVVKGDRRLVLQKVYDLFAENASIEDVLAVGRSEGQKGLFYSHLYAGLYYEAIGDFLQAKTYLVKAADEFAIADYMWHLACVHCVVRGWKNSLRQI